MNINFKNFAKAGSGSVHVNDLTIICGPNNSGKSYISYAMYSILNAFPKLFDIGLRKNIVRNKTEELLATGFTEFDITDSINNIKSCIDATVQKIKSNFEQYFEVPENHFSGLDLSLDFGEMQTNVSTELDFSKQFGIIGSYRNATNLTKVELRINMSCEQEKYLKNLNEINKYKLIKYLVNIVVLKSVIPIMPSPFLIASDRTTIPFPNKLSDNANINFKEALENFENTGDKNTTICKGSSNLKFPMIKIVRNFNCGQKNKSMFVGKQNSNKQLFEIVERLLDFGRFEENYGKVQYVQGKSGLTIPLHATSSSIRAVLPLDYFIRNVAQKNHMLIIDKPELNLHPDNQILMVRILARLANSGVKVFVTTHSDFIVREINNLISLGNANEYKEEVMKKYGIESEEVLEKSKISAYQTTNNKIEEVRISNYGIDFRALDAIISKENLKADEIAEIVVDEE